MMKGDKMLDHKEWLRINDIILIINSTENINSMRKYFLEAASLLIPYEKAMFYLLKEDDDIVRLVNPIFINVFSDFAKAYENTFEEAQYGRVAVNVRRSTAYRDTDLMPESVRINTDVYKSFMLPRNIPYGGGIILATNGLLLAEITFFRTEEQGDFTDKELYIMDIFKKHLEIRLIHEKYLNIDNSYLLMDKFLKLVELGLTNREIEIVQLIVEGLNTEGISNKLGISIYTTKKHIHNIFVKLKINNRLQLIKSFAGI